MRFVYFTLNKTEQKQKEMLGMISDEISPAGAFLRRVLYVGGGEGGGGAGAGAGQYEKLQFRCILLPGLNFTWTLTKSS